MCVMCVFSGKPLDFVLLYENNVFTKQTTSKHRVIKYIIPSGLRDEGHTLHTTGENNTYTTNVPYCNKIRFYLCAHARTPRGGGYRACGNIAPTHRRDASSSEQTAAAHVSWKQSFFQENKTPTNVKYDGDRWSRTRARALLSYNIIFERYHHHNYNG